MRRFAISTVAGVGGCGRRRLHLRGAAARTTCRASTPSSVSGANSATAGRDGLPARPMGSRSRSLASVPINVPVRLGARGAAGLPDCRRRDQTTPAGSTAGP